MKGPEEAGVSTGTGLGLPGSEDEWVEASLGFLRSCLEATPLRGHARRFASPASPVLRRCLLEGLGVFVTDLARWRVPPEGPAALFGRLPLAHHLLAVYAYRITHAMFVHELEGLRDVVFALSRQLTGIETYYSARIGPGLRIIHGSGTVLGAACTIGSQFTAYQNVTVGDKLGPDTGKRPVVGDQVIASTGAKILGPVEVGSKTIIGANAVVLHSLPGRCIAVGAPARVVEEGLSDADFALYWESLKG